MAKYPDLITTKKGLDLNSAANAAQKAVIFTKVVAGDGDVPSGTSISDLTAVVSPKMTLEITNKKNLGNGHFTIRATLGNEELESGFYAKEIGVYAKLDGDVEVLYAYTNGGNYVDYIPDKSSPIDAQIFNIDVIIGNLQQATIVINDETYVTVQDLEDHDKADNAHKNRFSLFQKIATLGDDIIKKLALTTTITVITALQTNSWFGQLLKMVLNASGVKYSMAQNGYICLGSFFGGLIIQWGKAPYENLVATATFAIAFSNTDYIGVATGILEDDSQAFVRGILRNHKTIVSCLFRTSETGGPAAEYIVIGR